MPDQRSPSRAAVTIVTHRGLPAGALDDQLLADALARLGVSSRFVPWDAPGINWAETPLTIVRSAWDYHRAPARWLTWIEYVAAWTTLINSPAILRWNTDKRYLRALAHAGVACVPAVFVASGEAVSLQSIARDHGWNDVVVKPAIGASAAGAMRFNDAASDARGERHLADLLARGVALVQPYLREVETARERSYVFIGGAFAHAFSKWSFNTDASGGAAILPHAAIAAEQALAEAALRAAPEAPLYARVDLVPTARGPLVMELELIEPDLGLRLHSAGAERLARVCVDLGG